MGFQVRALPRARFAPLYGAPDDALERQRARRLRAAARPGFPCRVSLREARIGESVLLVHFTHHDVAGPYRASHAVFVIDGADEARPAPGVLPETLRGRMFSLRGFDAAGAMVAADLADGDSLEPAIAHFFENSETAYLHVHNAKPGCFAARIDRA